MNRTLTVLKPLRVALGLVGVSFTIEARSGPPGPPTVVVVGPTPQLSHHDMALTDATNLHDIDGLSIDYFWSKCEEFLPDDWSLVLGRDVWPDTDGKKVRYEAIAILRHEGDPYLADFHTREKNDEGPWRVAYAAMPERALERLFYMLRDMI